MSIPAAKGRSEKDGESEGEQEPTPFSPSRSSSTSSSSQGWKPVWSLGTPPSQPLSQRSLPFQIHGLPDRSPALSEPGSSQPCSQPGSSSQPFSQPASLTQPPSSRGSESELSLPSQIHGPIGQSPVHSEDRPNSQASQPFQGPLNPPEYESKQQQRTSLSNKIEAESSICSTQSPKISRQSSSSTTSSQDGVKEMSRVSQEIAAQERSLEVKEWRVDEQEREEEKETLGFDARKEELRYQSDMREEKQKGWLQ